MAKGFRLSDKLSMVRRGSWADLNIRSMADVNDCFKVEGRATGLDRLVVSKQWIRKRVRDGAA